jgi:hypothetical protein
LNAQPKQEVLAPDPAAEARRESVRASLIAGGAIKAIVPQDFDGAWRIAQAVVGADMAPKSMKTVPQCAVAILHGLEVGLPPMQALQSIAVINGRPSVWGDGAIGLIQSSGLLDDQDEHFEGQEGTMEFKAVCVLKRKGKTRPYRAEFSMADAKGAGLLGKEGPWQTYRKRMLKMRARAWAMRDGFSDVLKGLSIAEEQEDVERARQPDKEATVEEVLADVPPPPAETATEATAPETTETAAVETQAADEAVSEREDPISSGPIQTDAFPGDKPMPKKEAAPVPDDGEIPWQLDRKLSDSDRDWLLSLKEAWEQCSTVEEIAAEAESIMDPAQDTVSPYVWLKASNLMDAHIERVNAQR